MRHCRYCYGTGHNIRSCPRIKEQAATNPNSWQAARVKTYKETTRTCTYCREIGHNKSTCKKLLADFKDECQKNVEYRKDLLEKMKSSGFGTGALVSTRYGDRPSLVTEIKWELIDTSNSGRSGYITVESENCVYSLELKSFGHNPGYKDYYLTLESGVSSQSVEQEVPSDWLNGSSKYIYERFFSKPRRRR